MARAGREKEQLARPTRREQTCAAAEPRASTPTAARAPAAEREPTDESDPSGAAGAREVQSAAGATLRRSETRSRPAQRRRYPAGVNEPGTIAQETERPPAAARAVAIISDGNGRWAEARGLSVSEGHEAAADTVIARTLDAAELGIEQLTVYSFSTENWTRPAEEVDALISLLGKRIEADTPGLHRAGIRIRFLGRRQTFSARLAAQMRWAEALTEHDTRMTLFVAFNYGGRAEIIDAARRFDGDSEEEFRELLYAPEMRDPDVVIRTGRERRLSNFLLWQSAYAELVFREELWPEFSRQALQESLLEFSERRRRFGGRG
jgi:undecaprenyl diphosphate synthase